MSFELFASEFLEIRSRIFLSRANFFPFLCSKRCHFLSQEALSSVNLHCNIWAVAPRKKVSSKKLAGWAFPSFCLELNTFPQKIQKELKKFWQNFNLLKFPERVFQFFVTCQWLCNAVHCLFYVMLFIACSIKNNLIEMFCFRTFGTIRKPNKMAAILLKKLNIYVQTMMLTIRNPNHSETEHCVRISNVIRKPNHSPMEHLSTIRNPNVFGIRAPTVQL